MRLYLRHLRNCDFQHTIDEFRLDVLGVGRIRQAESALKLSRDALDAAIALARFLPRFFAAPANGEHPFVRGNLYCFRIYAGQIHLQYELVGLFMDINRR